jgi:hypothetical protein
MIGIIGPPDSVRQVSAVAESSPLDVTFVTRTYHTHDEVPGLVTALAPSCPVILFTGRAPYAIAQAAPPTRTRLEFIPYEGADLLLVLAKTLLDNRLTIDRLETLRVSVDSIDPEMAAETAEDLGLHQTNIHPVLLSPESTDLASVIEEHAQLFRAGMVDICFTCLDTVYAELHSRGIRVERVGHTRLVVRTALDRCVLAHKLQAVEAGQVAVVLFEGVGGADAGAADAALVDALVDDTAQAISADVLRRDANGSAVVTTRGIIERWLGDGDTARAKLRDHAFSQLVHMGIGLGESVPDAENNARRALDLSRRNLYPHVAGPDGTIFEVGSHLSPGTRTRETRAASASRAQEIGVSVVSLQRLIEAVRISDQNLVTPAQLARSYRIAPRSARRLLSLLNSAGYADVAGTEASVGPGRPHTVYRVHVDRLLAPDHPHEITEPA